MAPVLAPAAARAQTPASGLVRIINPFAAGGTSDRFYRDVVAAVREEANYNTFVNKFRSEVPLPAPDELRQMIVEELPFWGKIIQDNNIKGGA